MRAAAVRVLAVMAVLGCAIPARAELTLEEREAEEARLSQVFVDHSAALVASLNANDFDRFVSYIDKDDMLDRVFGLRLIDQRIKRDFREDMRDGFPAFIKSAFAMEAEDGIRAKLLVVESRARRGRAVVRFDMSHFQVNYVEFDLALDDADELVIVDWTDYLWGHQYTDRMGLMLVQLQPNVNSVRKLIDFPNVREQQVFQVTEILKSARDRNFDRYFQIFDNLDDNLKRQRAVLKAGLDAVRIARKRRHQRTLLVEIAKYYPNDPLFSLSLLDYYIPARQYDKAYDALVRLRNKLRIDDAVMNARLSSTKLVMQDVEAAVTLADKAVTQEPDLELAWWALLRAEVAAGNDDGSLAALDQLTRQFGHALDAEALSKDPSLKRFSQSDAFRNWVAANTAAIEANRAAAAD